LRSSRSPPRKWTRKILLLQGHWPGGIRGARFESCGAPRAATGAISVTEPGDLDSAKAWSSFTTGIGDFPNWRLLNPMARYRHDHSGRYRPYHPSPRVNRERDLIWHPRGLACFDKAVRQGSRRRVMELPVATADAAGDGGKWAIHRRSAAAAVRKPKDRRDRPGRESRSRVPSPLPTPALSGIAIRALFLDPLASKALSLRLRVRELCALPNICGGLQRIAE
jgi:hypothetical protein